MKWQELSVSDAEKMFEEYKEYQRSGKVWDKCPPEYASMKRDLEELLSNVMIEQNIQREDIGKKSGNCAYRIDLYFGLGMYQLLNQKYGMNVRLASSPGVWRYISMVIAPDVIEMRYDVSHPDRYWKKAKRLWFRVLWWYIYLSWQGSTEKTEEVLRNNTTDEILQLVDRAGKGGYRVDLYREIMKVNGQSDRVSWTKNKMFRKIMVLNTARVQVMEPALVDGGEKGYVSDLCEYFEGRK